MKVLLLILLLSSVSCLKQKAKPDSNTSDEPKKTEVSKQNDTKVSDKSNQTKFEVDKLTEKEKLHILMGKAENDRSKSFQKVISFLDPYGETFAYLNFQDTKDKYTNKALKMWEFIASNTDVEQESIDKFSKFKDYVHALGIMDIDAIGLSHYKMENGLVKNKFALHKRISDSQNLYWHAFGKNKKFDCFEFLPEKTVFAGGFRVNIEVLMELNSLYVDKFKPEGDDLKKSNEKYKLLESLNEVVTGEISAAVFWDYDAKPLELDLAGERLQDLTQKLSSDVGLALILELKKDADFKKVIAIDWQKHLKTFELGDKDKGFIIVRKENYVILADKRGKEFLESGKFLKDKESFKEKLKHVQPVGTMFNYLDPVVTEKLYAEINNAIPEGVMNQGFEILISKEDMKYHFLNVMENRPEGFYYSGVSNGGSYLFFWANYISSIFHHLMFLDQINSVEQIASSIEDMDLESISKLMNTSVQGITALQAHATKQVQQQSGQTKEEKKPEGTIEETKRDLSFIRFALDKYRKSNNAYYPTPDGAKGIAKLVNAKLLTKSEYLISSFDHERIKPKSSKFSESEVSYLYLGSNLTKETAGYYYPLVVTKPGVVKEGFLAILANNHIVHFKTGGKSLSTILSALNKKYRYNDRQKDVLREKFKALGDL